MNSILVPATIERFNAIEFTQPDLWRKLHLSAYELTKEGCFLLGTGSREYRPNDSLSDEIRLFWERGCQTFFIENNGDVHGFFAYKIKDDTIYEMNVFSLVYDIGIGRNLREFVSAHVQKYNIIVVVHKDNKATRFYERVRREYGGSVTESTYSPSYLSYRIEKGSCSVKDRCLNVD